MNSPLRFWPIFCYKGHINYYTWSTTSHWGAFSTSLISCWGALVTLPTIGSYWTSSCPLGFTLSSKFMFSPSHMAIGFPTSLYGNYMCLLMCLETHSFMGLMSCVLTISHAPIMLCVTIVLCAPTMSLLFL